MTTMMTISEHKLLKTQTPASPPACLSSCFSGSVVHHDRIAGDADDYDDASARDSRTPRSPYAWLKSTAAQEIPEIRFRCRSLIARIGRNGCRRRHNSSDFSYDPSSYALNFEDDGFGRGRGGDDEDSFPLRDFTARLPVSPKPDASAKRIVGFS